MSQSHTSNPFPRNQQQSNHKQRRRDMRRGNIPSEDQFAKSLRTHKRGHNNGGR